MRITARFNTADEAEFAAAALRRSGEGIFDVTIREKPTGARRENDFAPMGFFTNISTGSTAGVPVPVYGGSNDASVWDDSPKSAVVDVICRQSVSKRVSSILLSGGGHDLRGM